MPMPVIHLCIAKSLLETLKIQDKASFYMGSIAPDAIYRIPTYYDLEGMYENYLTAHLTIQDFDAWRKNVIDFISSDNKNQDFYTGYGVHVLTDIYWKETVFAPFQKECSELGKSYSETRAIYYSDAEIFDKAFYESFNLKSDVWGYLASCEGFGIEGLITAEDVQSWKDNTLKLFDNTEPKHNTVNYFTYELMSDFIKSTVAKISELLS